MRRRIHYTIIHLHQTIDGIDDRGGVFHGLKVEVEHSLANNVERHAVVHGFHVHDAAGRLVEGLAQARRAGVEDPYCAL